MWTVHTVVWLSGTLLLGACDGDQNAKTETQFPFEYVHRRHPGYPYAMGDTERKRLLDRIKGVKPGEKCDAVIKRVGAPDEEFKLISKTWTGFIAHGGVVEYHMRKLEETGGNGRYDQDVTFYFCSDGKLDKITLDNVPGFASAIKGITVTERNWDNASNTTKVMLYEPGKKPVPVAETRDIMDDVNDLFDYLKGPHLERGQKNGHKDVK